MKTRTLLVLVILLLAGYYNGFSKTITVTTETDSITGSLRDAVLLAGSGKSRVFIRKFVKQ